MSVNNQLCLSPNVLMSFIFTNVIMELTYILHTPKRTKFFFPWKQSWMFWNNNTLEVWFIQWKHLRTPARELILKENALINERVFVCTNTIYTHKYFRDGVKTNLIPLPWGQLSLHNFCPLSLGIRMNTHEEQNCPNWPRDLQCDTELAWPTCFLRGYARYVICS